MRRLFGAALLVAAAFVLNGIGSANTPGRHPRYLSARTDLRTAQWYLRVKDEPNVMEHIRGVDDSCEKAVQYIDRAAYMDQKNLEDHPNIDQNLERKGRFEKVMALLQRAHSDVTQPEDDQRAMEARTQAIHYIDAAMDQLKRASHDLKMDHMQGY